MLESYGLLWYNKEQQVVLGKNIFRLSSRTARCADGVFPVQNSWYNTERPKNSVRCEKYLSDSSKCYSFCQ